MKKGDHAKAMDASSEAEASGGYTPIQEFDRVAASVRRRSQAKG